MKKIFSFKSLSLNIYQIAFVFLFSVTIFACTTMFIQYSYLKAEYYEFLGLQREYRGYLLKLKCLIEDFKKLSDQDNSSLSEEKKKFLVVNRGPEYLKNSLIQYLRNNNLEYELNELQKSNCIPSSNAIRQSRRKRPTKQVESSYNLIRSIADVAFSWPLDFNSFWISSYFGPRKNPDRSNGFHYGIDLAALTGTIVKASASGIVIEAGYAPGYGNTIVIQHNKKYKTRYAHLHRINVKNGQKVQRGERIATVGNTGLVRSSGSDPSHLHFEVYVRNKRVNPLLALPKIKLK